MNCLRNLKNVLVFGVINNEIVIFLDELLHNLSVVKSKVCDAELSRVVVNRQIVLRKTTRLLHLCATLVLLSIWSTVGKQSDHAWALTTSMYEVPLVNG